MRDTVDLGDGGGNVYVGATACDPEDRCIVTYMTGRGATVLLLRVTASSIDLLASEGGTDETAAGYRDGVLFGGVIANGGVGTQGTPLYWTTWKADGDALVETGCSPLGAADPTSAQTGPCPPAGVQREGRELRQFRSPSGNVQCTIGTVGVDCWIGTDAFEVTDPADECPGLRHLFTLDASGPGTLDCTTLTPDTSTEVLGYGEQAYFADVTCASEQTGITCRNTRTDHGFTVSRDRYSLF